MQHKPTSVHQVAFPAPALLDTPERRLCQLVCRAATDDGRTDVMETSIASG